MQALFDIQNCKDCTAAEANPLSPLYRAGCLQCTARMLAHSPARWSAVQAGAITPAYRDALQAAFGQDWKQGAAWVKVWADRIQGAKE